MTNKNQLDALDKMIGETLARAPTTAQNAEHIRAIEDDETAEFAEAVKEGWYTQVEADHLVFEAFKKRHEA